jgi:hypothetical protein
MANPTLAVSADWLPLPTELELMVLSYLLTNSEPLDELEHTEFVRGFLVPLILVGNRELAYYATESCECVKCLHNKQKLTKTDYKNNTFVLSHHMRYASESSDRILPSVRYPAAKFGSMIRYITLPMSTWMISDVADPTICTEKQWQWLIAPSATNGTSAGLTSQAHQTTHTPNWQTCFSNLAKFDLELIVRSGRETQHDASIPGWPISYFKYTCYEPHVPQLLLVIENSVHGIRSRQLTIKVKCVGCRMKLLDVPRSGSLVISPCRYMPPSRWCSCEAEIEHALKRIFKKC